MYNQYQNAFGTSSFGMPRGGNVQSYYGQNQQQSVNPYASSYQTANYRGNQRGHDQSLRGDSFYPAQQMGGRGMETDYSSFRYAVRGNEQAFNNVNNVSSQFGFTSSPVNGGMGTSFSAGRSYGTGYGPSQMMGSNAGMMGASSGMMGADGRMMGASSGMMGADGRMMGANAGMIGSNAQMMGSNAQMMGSSAQMQNPEAYHTANYRGNVPGHDQSLRGDSFYPAQQMGGRTMETDTSSFRYAVRGNEQALNSVNNVNSQFGFTTAPVNGGMGTSMMRSF